MSQLHLKDLQLHCTQGSFCFSPVFPLALLCGTAGCPGTLLSLLDVGASYRCWIWIVAPLGAPLRIITHLCFTVKKYVFSHQHLLQPQQCQLARVCVCVCVCVCATVKMCSWKQHLQWKYYHKSSFEYITRCLYATKSPEKNGLCTKTTWVGLGKLGVWFKIPVSETTNTAGEVPRSPQNYLLLSTQKWLEIVARSP